MKTLIATATALLLSTGAYAFDTQNDLYGWVVFDNASASQSHAVQPGVGDAYGSILLDTEVGKSGDVQPGHADNYGSILLDI